MSPASAVPACATLAFIGRAGVRARALSPVGRAASMAKPSAMAHRRSLTPFGEQVESARAQRNWTLRELAARSEVDVGFLSRALRRAEYKRPSMDLMRRVARALELAPEDFPEFREQAVVEWISTDPRARDEAFRRLLRAQRDGS